MKLDQNIKICSGYKTLAVATLLFVSGACTTHKNVVLGVEKFDSTFVLLRDIETGQSRYYKAPAHEYDKFKYLCGDTVSLVVLANNYDEDYYLNKRIIDYNDVSMLYNTDSISYRKQRNEFLKLRQRLEDEIIRIKAPKVQKEYEK